MDFDQASRARTIYVLVATTNPNDRQLITECVHTSRPGSKLLYCSTADELRECLRTTAVEYYNFPRLLVLDLDIAPYPVFWALLEEIRANYRLLVIVVICSAKSAETIQRAYDLGAHALICKADKPQAWQQQANALAGYWLQTVSLPKPDLYS